MYFVYVVVSLEEEIIVGVYNSSIGAENAIIDYAHSVLGYEIYQEPIHGTVSEYLKKFNIGILYEKVFVD